MAPEQCDPEGHPGEVGPASDVWGLGATLFHAVCGEVPFPRAREDRHSADPLVRFPQLTEPPLPMSGELPRPLRELVSAMLAPRAEERPAPGDVVLALEPLVDALPRKARLRPSRHAHPLSVIFAARECSEQCSQLSKEVPDVNQGNAPSIYLAIAADGARPEQDQRSLPRKTLVVLTACLWLFAMPLFWVASSAEPHIDQPQAVLSKSGSGSSGSGGDDDDSGPGGGDHDDDSDDTARDDTDTADPKTDNTATNTHTNTRTGAADTATKTGTNTGTGRETRAQKTDRRGPDTGASTRGETDPATTPERPSAASRATPPMDGRAKPRPGPPGRGSRLPASGPLPLPAALPARVA